MEAKHCPQTEGGMKIPKFFAVTEGTVQLNLAPFAIIYGSPNPGTLEILE